MLNTFSREKFQTQKRLGIKKLGPFTHKENLASIHLLKKAGFSVPKITLSGKTFNEIIFTSSKLDR